MARHELKAANATFFERCCASLTQSVTNAMSEYNLRNSHKEFLITDASVGVNPLLEPSISFIINTTVMMEFMTV